MAQAFLNHSNQSLFVGESAGLEPGTLNPLAIEAMSELGIDISHQPANSVWEVFKAGRTYGYVITVCDAETAEKCPIFPGSAVRLHWSFHDPSTFTGTPEEKLEKVREVRDAIAAQVEAFCAEKAVVVEAST